MANFRLSSQGQNGLVSNLAAQIDAGINPGTIKLYDGFIPADANTSITTQRLLAVILFSRPPFLTPNNGQIVANNLLSAIATAAGTASWARIQDGNGNTIFDCDVGTSSSNTIQLNTNQLLIQGPVTILSCIVTMPAGS